MSSKQPIALRGRELAQIPARALCIVISLFGFASLLLHTGLALGSGSPSLYAWAFVSACWTWTALAAGLASDEKLCNSCQTRKLVAAMITGMGMLASCLWWYSVLTAFGGTRVAALLVISPFAVVAMLLPIVIWVRAQKAARANSP